MRFGNTYRRVLRSRSASHLWIDLHRLVEGYSRTLGQTFGSVFADLEERFGFSRRVRARWPDVATMHAAATWLADQREAVLAERRAWIADQRRRKAEGRREHAPAALRAHEARGRAYAAIRARVGVWGWRIRRGA